ncbi:hydrogenase nickel incorporation protein HypA [Actinoplanes ianthinogenes]|uniref:Hydrogenase maturation factor HypA n=1 Tax=Actinoplanes ianthinogenes TaxID=122358 RepID=A0ABM7M2V0_9ACTN|nr:hydrogenase maturation nickel metallochaperone HypA [Actinoplanes ianthinogenes]BCJ45920.1 hydrogenase nickel incorporation protein HypA [Actinoplanes ianthinogenes]GGR31136.1 hydrogenase nickel incorporation protein HypA [Actinoplanes ianthinogenes]
MHELSIAEGIAGEVRDRAAGRPVRRVTVRVGALHAVQPDALRFGFQLAAAGIELVIEHRPATVLCRACGRESELPDQILLCSCGSADVAVTGGRELEIVTMELA